MLITDCRDGHPRQIHHQPDGHHQLQGILKGNDNFKSPPFPSHSLHYTQPVCILRLVTFVGGFYNGSTIYIAMSSELLVPFP